VADPLWGSKGLGFDFRSTEKELVRQQAREKSAGKMPAPQESFPENNGVF
jgi:hypothetical protein